MEFGQDWKYLKCNFKVLFPLLKTQSSKVNEGGLGGWDIGKFAFTESKKFGICKRSGGFQM